MTSTGPALAYLVASVCFIMALRGLSSPTSARTGNIFAVTGMVIAVLTTLLLPGVLSYVEHLILPVSVVAVNFMALVARMTRSTVLEVLSEDYVRTARAKGLRERAVLMRHALKVAFPPVLTVIGLGFGGLLTGTILVETLFSIPGIGSWVGVALRARDTNVIQAVILLSALIYVVVNLVVDIAYAYLDPRIRYA